MSQFKTIFRLGLSFFGALVLSSCYFDKEGGSSSSSQVSFSSDVLSVFNSNCTSGCHSGGTPSGSLSLSSADSSITGVYSSLNTGSYFNTSNVAQSKLLTQAADSDSGDPHSAGEILATTSSGYKTLESWISEGAFNDDCTSTPSVSLSTDLASIFSGNCLGSGCHQSGGVNPQLDANVYTNIQSAQAIDTSSPRSSSLLRKSLGQDSHGGSTIFADENVANWRSIYCWIKQGGSDN
ncbi:MAG: hypothetical protein R3A11_04970 [Bdellovibrionota bacterium]